MLCPQKVMYSLDLGIFHLAFHFYGSLLKLIMDISFFFVTKVLLAETHLIMLPFLKTKKSAFLICF